ncbi:Acylpyruvase FAHD1, mitochondrial [Frankliniella fusca]|uniref:Oxaloacetate tautomerase FAHD1, mitochondrial n=1 Tax=Frankliniella fusca TaxID=407009 RepID=A0AAE1HZL4_9NEOP|nr:Acylpyruvase FAHD1, mitochondrial [Frankliniella fusca]
MQASHLAARMAGVNLTSFSEVGRKIVGAALNYKSLAQDLKVQHPPRPVIFLKPTSSYINVGQDIEISKSDIVNYEVELGVIIGKKCKNIPESSALDCIGGYCLALDMTNVSILSEARKASAPWDLGKGFDTACPVSKFIPKEKIKNPDDVKLWLKLNGTIKQNGNTNDMIFSTAHLISFVSQHMTLEPGDLLLTGSPSGVGPVRPNDVLECGLEDLVTMKFSVKATD